MVSSDERKMSNYLEEKNLRPSCIKYPWYREDGDCCYRFVRIQGKGIGIVARRDIALGELVLQERLILSWKSNDSLKSQLKKLTKHERVALFDLSNVFLECDDRLEGIVNTNAFYCESDDCFCLFLTTSRFNHSCVPNIQPMFSSPDIRIYASFAIKKDEELCLSYISLWDSPGAMKENLKKRYRFDCNCELCSMNDQIQMKKILSYRLRYGKIVSTVSLKYHRDEKMELHSIMQIFETLKKAKLWFPHLILVHSIHGFEIAMANKDLSKAQKFLKLARHANLIVFGKLCSSNHVFAELMDILNINEPMIHRKRFASYKLM